MRAGLLPGATAETVLLPARSWLAMSRCDEELDDETSLMAEFGLAPAKLGLEAWEAGVDELVPLNAGLCVTCSRPGDGVVALVGAVHRNELRKDFACRERVMRKELLDDVEERLDAVAGAALSWS